MRAKHLYGLLLRFSIQIGWTFALLNRVDDLEDLG